jgi:EAL domain-containing protein (putative c-di-GMP-specific phosphodiesterase class I)
MSAEPRRLGRVIVLSESRPRQSAHWDPALDRILAGRKLSVAYQPILARHRAADGSARWRVASAEALIRACDGRGSLLRPDKLLPLVERAGLMHRLFLFVLADSLAAARCWERQTGARLEVSINLHVEALLDDALPKFLLGLLDAAAFAPERLTLELTEGTAIGDLRHAAANVRRFRADGIRVALDDFGAGFSTTTRLQWLECDELKIDRALVQGLERSDEQRCVLEHLIALAHSHGMAACAEGVETATALRLLGAFGCDRVQGYLIARPQAADTLPGAIREWQRRGDDWQVDGDEQLLLPGLFGDPDAESADGHPVANAFA